jgi:hypothetical protein
VPTYQPLGQARDDVRHESCHSTYGNERCREPITKGGKQGLAILDLGETLVKLVRSGCRTGVGGVGNHAGCIHGAQTPDANRAGCLACGLSAQAAGSCVGSGPTEVRSLSSTWDPDQVVVDVAETATASMKR